MRTLLLASALSLTLAVPACAADEPQDAFVLPSWMDVDYSTPVPDFDELLAGVVLPADACELLVTTSSMPFESTPAEITALANDYEDLGRDVGQLEPATSAVSASLRAAADRGAHRQAMLSPWFDRAASAALRELSYLAANHCGSAWGGVPLGPADRLIDLAQADHPDSVVLDDIGSWSMSITGSPVTAYWAFGYLGDEGVALCDELSETLASAGFAGTEIAVHDADVNDLAEGFVGGDCKGT
jgi:hypothetical protein